MINYILINYNYIINFMLLFIKLIDNIYTFINHYLYLQMQVTLSVSLMWSKLYILLVINIPIYIYIYIYIYSKLSVSRTTDKSDFSISRTHLIGLVGFVSSYMLN